MTYGFSLENPIFASADRRYKVLWVTPELIFEGILRPMVLPDGNVAALKVTGIPDDARVEAMCYDPMQNRVGLRIWSQSFDQVIEGYSLPELAVQIHQYFYKTLPPEDECDLPTIIGMTL